jgi:hypothetical protein
VNGASTEGRPAKSRPHEQQQLQMQQQYQDGEYLLPQHHSNTLFSSIPAPTMTHSSMVTIHINQNYSYAPTPNNNNYFSFRLINAVKELIMEDRIRVQRIVIIEIIIIHDHNGRQVI